MAVTADRPAPYAPTKTILDIIDRYRHRSMTTPINAEVLSRAGIPESLISRTLQALITLDLISEETGEPTATFEAIRLAPEDEYKKRLEAWLKGAYADIFSYVDPAKDSETRIRDAFRTYQPRGQQERMVSLFTALCAAAGMAAAKSPEQATSTTAGTSSRARTPLRRSVTDRVKEVHRHKPDNAGTLPQPLAGLLATLPSAEDGWTTNERERFLATFSTVLDYCIPVIGENETAAARTATAA
jgi:hypothetical protein